MMRYALALLVVAGIVSPAPAWNAKAHMVVARLAWKELSDTDRGKIVKILTKHPHFTEYLKDNRPSNIPEDEWVFMRAATWSDWVRGGPPERRKYHRAAEHFINIPFVDPPMSATPPKPPEVTIVTALAKHKMAAIGASNQTDLAVDVTWVFHLVGDIHQPLHCAALFGAEFPQGDRGGTRARFRLGNQLVQLHGFWDGLLGNQTSLSSIGSSVLEIEALLSAFPNAIKDDLQNNTTPEQWATEGFEAAKKHGYLNGALSVANSDDDPEVNDVMRAPANYEENAGEVARFAVAKAGKRLAKVLKEIADAN